MKKIYATLVAAALIAGMAAHIAEACRLEEGNEFVGFSSAEVGIDGDINVDGEVNLTDLSLLGQAWNSRIGNPHYNECADINNDGVINSGDLSILGQHWGERRFLTKCFPLRPGNMTPRVHIYQSGNLSWLTGTWSIAENEGIILLDCEEIGIKSIYNIFSNCSRIRILSDGDFIENIHHYKDDPQIVISAYKTSKCVIWCSVLNNHNPHYESWMVIVKDNGDHYVRLEISSCIGDMTCGTPPPLATQIIVIRW